MATQKERKPLAPPASEWAPALALSWLVPGGGHLLLKKTGRGLLLMAAITSMFLCGLMMRGAMFEPQSGDLLTTLINVGGFIGNLASEEVAGVMVRMPPFVSQGKNRFGPAVRHHFT